MGMTLGPMVRTLFALFLCVLTVPLVVLVAWGLAFSYQKESIPNMIFFVYSVLTNRSQSQRRSTYRNVLALKLLVLSKKFKPVLY